MELTTCRVATSCCGCGTGDTEEDLDVFVQGHGFSPVIPGCEVEVVLRVAAWDEGLETTVVVVELDEYGVEIDGSIEHGSICGVGVWTLWSGCEVVFLSSCGCCGVHQS